MYIKKSLGRCNKYNDRNIEHIFSYIKNDVYETRNVLEDAVNTMLDILSIYLVIMIMMTRSAWVRIFSYNEHYVKETRSAWVDAISHLVLTLNSLSHQKEYELYLKTAFR